MVPVAHHLQKHPQQNGAVSIGWCYGALLQQKHIREARYAAFQLGDICSARAALVTEPKLHN